MSIAAPPRAARARGQTSRVDGLVSRKVDVHQALGQDFVDYANAVLGAYRPVNHPRRPD